jgi:hypothetical protein
MAGDCSCPVARAVILVLDMRSFIQHEIQQAFLNFQLAVVVDQSQLPKFVHKNIHARPGRSNQRCKRVLIDLYGYRFQAKVVAIIGQEQESTGQPHLAGIEQLVDQVRFNSGGPSQQMSEKVVGKFLVLMKQADYDFSF